MMATLRGHLHRRQKQPDDAGLLASGSRNIGAGSGPGDFVELHRVFNSGSRTNIMVTYEINGSGTAPAAVSFDDFFFTPVPEPATLLALGMGLGVIGFARYRAGAKRASRAYPPI